jgi:hypothetical protein
MPGEQSMDDEILQLQEVIADLRRQNAALRGMLLEAIDLAGLAIRLDAAEDDEGGSHEDGDRLEASIPRVSKVG